MGYFSKPVATIILPKSPTFLGNFYKGFKNCIYSSEIILATFYWSLCFPPKKSLTAFSHLGVQLVLTMPGQANQDIARKVF